ncbi:MAG: endonuclease [Bacteroidetes bacterium HGW-Bacteroidetes-21]|jgi:putative endonuclease|nr:MAG: endonuclease [Bacteroidetes bacterium HGW-Bacteroidetes-21]
MFTVYALYSKEFDKIYVGQTSDLAQRMHYHNELSEEGWTKKYRPWIVVYTENVESRSEALKREKQLKSYRGRVFVREKVAALKEAGWSPPIGG